MKIRHVVIPVGNKLHQNTPYSSQCPPNPIQHRGYSYTSTPPTLPPTACYGATFIIQGPTSLKAEFPRLSFVKEPFK